jgi:hypothetical protein
MRLAAIAAAMIVLFTGSLALAQNAGPGPNTSSGDAQVSPATPPAGGAAAPAAAHSAPGGGIASGALNNGTTGDTIGTGSATSGAPAAATPASGAGDRK